MLLLLFILHKVDNIYVFIDIHSLKKEKYSLQAMLYRCELRRLRDFQD
jgi:hypothetical protein